MELRPSLRVLVLFPASWSLAESMSDTESRDDGTARISTGIAGLDDILCGGLDPDRLYLIEGTPGTGKTTLALQFLLEGSKKGETGLYVTLSESEKELRVVAARHGWSLDGLSIFELFPPARKAVGGAWRLYRLDWWQGWARWRSRECIEGEEGRAEVLWSGWRGLGRTGGHRGG